MTLVVTSLTELVVAFVAALAVRSIDLVKLDRWKPVEDTRRERVWWCHRGGVHSVLVCGLPRTLACAEYAEPGDAVQHTRCL